MSMDGRRGNYRLTRVYTLRDGDPAVHVREDVVNLTGHDMQFSWGHHPTFGVPFIDGAEVDVPAKTLRAEKDPGVYRYPYHDKLDIRQLMPGGSNGFRMLFLTDLEHGRFVIRNRSLGIALGFDFDKELFPVVWYWNTRGSDGKMHDSFALEFVTGYPLSMDPARAAMGSGLSTEYSFGFV